MRQDAPTIRPFVAAIGLGACAAWIGGGGGAARAEPVAYPKAEGRVELDVPKDWRVDYTPFGLELAAPDRTSFIVAGLVKADSKAIDAWAKEAGGRMRSFGLVIDPDAKAPKPKAAASNAAAPKAAALDAAAPKAAMPPMSVLNLPKDRNAFTFSGTPSLEIVPEVSGPVPGDAAPTINEVLRSAPPAGTAMPKIPFRSIQYLGASLDGKPFDLQLIIYKVGPNEDFLVEQTSGSQDPRAAAIVTSARIIK